jgi:hypothetical protein
VSLQKVLQDSVTHITETLAIPADGRLEPNLHMLWMNAVGDPALWQQLLDHLCWPEENPFPEGLFMVSPTFNGCRYEGGPPGYSRIMSILEELYDE